MSSVEQAAATSVSPSLKVSAMSAEGESEMLIDPRPIRYSGFFALFLGLLSVFALFGQPMLMFAVFAVVIALFALRPYSGARPVGYLAAIAGLTCAILFAVWGVTERSFRSQFMSERAAVFAGDWLQLIVDGDYELACELQQSPASRQSESMPLNQYYRESEAGKQVMKSFRENPTVIEMINAGTSVQWQLNRPPTYSTQNGRHLTTTVWKDDSGKVKSLVKIGMEYLPPKKDEVAQWAVQEITTWVDR
ncbi:MAG TPA: hypothetical protein DDZ51_30605 [Planctomycetaceae bacterium]|nr:hypothetical protein [Planctomycetaceae bacterium]